MNNEYIRETLAFIKQSDLPLRFPETRDVSFLPDGKRVVKLSFFSRMRYNKIAHNRLLLQMTIFTLVDSLIDLQYPDLYGLSFKNRYDGLSSGNDGEIIFRETYRLLKLIRNATIHCREGISELNGDLHIRHPHRSTNFELHCSSDSILWMYSFVLLYVHEGGERSAYREALWRGYYDKIIAGVRTLTDEFRMPLGSISDGLRLNVSVRQIVGNPKYTVDDSGGLLFERGNMLGSSEPSQGIDYKVERAGRHFIIPDEALGVNGELSSDALDKWDISGYSRIPAY